MYYRQDKLPLHHKMSRFTVILGLVRVKQISLRSRRCIHLIAAILIGSVTLTYRFIFLHFCPSYYVES